MYTSAPIFCNFFFKGRHINPSYSLIIGLHHNPGTIALNIPDQYSLSVMGRTGPRDAFLLLLLLLRLRFLGHQIITMASDTILILHVRCHLMNRLDVMTPFTDPDILAPLVLCVMAGVASLQRNAMVGILNADNINPIDRSRPVTVLTAIRGGS